MAGITLEKGRVIYEVGKPLTALHLITNGRVSVSYPGGCFYLNKGDVIGICEICSEVHFLSYVVDEDVNIVTYPFPNITALDDLLGKHGDLARLFVLSSIRQICSILEHSSISALNCSSLYQNLNEDYSKYKEICSACSVSAAELTEYDSVSAFIGEESPDLWLSGYYLSLGHIYSGNNYQIMVAEGSITSGMLRKGSLDFRKAYFSLDEQYSYVKQINNLYFNETESDLFSLYTSLYYKLGADNKYSDELYAAITQMILLYGNEGDCDIDPALLRQRINTFHDNIALLKTEQPKAEEEIDEAGDTSSELINSLLTILDYSEADDELRERFTSNIAAYKKTEDKFSSDKSICDLRQKITSDYYELYKLIFFKTQEDDNVPVTVKMFLLFGYVDENLAGIGNAAYMRNLAETLSLKGENGVYTFYDWLCAINKGEIEPSRNEFDQDYADYIHKQKLSGTITDNESRILLNDTKAKVKYELSNCFAPVNKMSYGRISVYCPIFIKENIFKDLESSYVTTSKITNAIKNIKQIDYSIFYRENLAMEYLDLLGREPVHYEFLPNVILMPNVGIRGVMWQEIEGKKRTSPSRMFISIFHLEDFDMTFLRMMGEYRWELCKRVQGSRWNDITDRSLTSEYFDYVQFYRKNRDLTQEAKEKVRLSLQRAKNSFKEMFVKDYMIWIMFESNSSPRLNKVARKIFFTYCPFNAERMEVVSKNPMYTELLSRYKVLQAQKLHRLDLIIQKLANNNKAVPAILESEFKFIEGTIE